MADDKLDALKNKLYSPNSPDVVNKRVQPLTEKQTLTPHDWVHEKSSTDEIVFEIPAKKQSKFGAWVFAALALIFCVASFAFAWFYIINKGGAGENVSIQVTGPVSTPGGKEFSIDVTVENRNNFAIDLVDLVIEYPPGTKDAVDITKDIGTYREGLGTLESGASVTRTVKAILFGSEREKQQILAKAEYHIPNSNAVFEKSKLIDVLIETGPVEFVLETLKEAIINQEVELNLRVRSNTDQDLKNLVVKAEYPAGFSFLSSTPAPAEGNNVWTIENLGALSTSTIKIKGIFSGEASTERFFRFEGGVADKRDPTKLAGIFASSLEGVKLVKPFLGVILKVNDEESEGDVVTTAGKMLAMKIEFTNNLDVPITDAAINVKLEGQVLDKRNVNAYNGFYRSNENKITWNKSSNPDMVRLDPGKSGFVSLSFSSLPFSASAPLIKNQEIIMDISAAASRPTDNNVPEEIKSTIIKRIKIESDVALTARAVYSIGPFANTGPLPPKPEQKTTYTIIWTLTNTSNDVNNVFVTGQLPPYVSWNNIVSPENERITYDEKTGKVSWNVGTITSGTGFTKPAKEIAFQLTLFPSVNQLGEVPFLIQDIALTGVDSFTKTTITRELTDNVTIRMTTDPSYTSSMDRVSE